MVKLLTICDKLYISGYYSGKRNFASHHPSIDYFYNNSLLHLAVLFMSAYLCIDV